MDSVTRAVASGLKETDIVFAQERRMWGEGDETVYEPLNVVKVTQAGWVKAVNAKGSETFFTPSSWSNWYSERGGHRGLYVAENEEEATKCTSTWERYLESIEDAKAQREAEKQAQREEAQRALEREQQRAYDANSGAAIIAIPTSDLHYVSLVEKSGRVTQIIFRLQKAEDYDWATRERYDAWEVGYGGFEGDRCGCFSSSSFKTRANASGAPDFNEILKVLAYRVW